MSCIVVGMSVVTVLIDVASVVSTSIGQERFSQKHRLLWIRAFFYLIGLKNNQINAPCSEVVKLGVKVDGDGVVVGAEVVATGVAFVAMVEPKV